MRSFNLISHQQLHYDVSRIHQTVHKYMYIFEASRLVSSHMSQTFRTVVTQLSPDKIECMSGQCFDLHALG